MRKGLWLVTCLPAVLALFIAGCTGPAEESPEPTKPEIQNTIIEVNVSTLSISCPAAVMPDMTYKTARMWFDFEIYNPDDVEVILESFEYAVYGNEHTVAESGTMVRGDNLDRTIAPFGVTPLDFPLPYISKDDDPALWSDMVEGNVTWRIDGVAHIRTPTESLSIPFECIVTDYYVDIDARCLEEE